MRMGTGGNTTVWCLGEGVVGQTVLKPLLIGIASFVVLLQSFSGLAYLALFLSFQASRIGSLDSETGPTEHWLFLIFFSYISVFVI